MNNETQECMERLVRYSKTYTPEQLEDLIRASMALAYTHGKRDGAREVEAAVGAVAVVRKASAR
jgi:hypothetical protein